MSASEVHPLHMTEPPPHAQPRAQRTRTWDPSTSSSSSPSAATTITRRLVLYTLVGEEPEVAEPGKSYTPDTHWNAFALPTDVGATGEVRLQDVARAFPLGGAFHFAFRNERGAFLDLTNPRARVPWSDRKIIARVTPLGGFAQ